MFCCVQVIYNLSCPLGNKSGIVHEHRSKIVDKVIKTIGGFISMKKKTGKWLSYLLVASIVLASGMISNVTTVYSTTANLALNQTVTASNVYNNESGFAAAKAVDGSGSTRWATDDLENVWIEIDFVNPTVFNKTVFTECTSYGQRIDSYKIQYFDGSSWKDAATGGVPSANQIDTFTSVTSNKVRLFLTDNDGKGPTVWEFEVYNEGGSQPPAPSGNTYYVSPSGSDNNPGTIAQPFKTVEKARETVDAINDNMTEDIIVYLRGGQYSISDPIKFDSSDSGSNDYHVIYKAYDGEIPVIDGGVKLPNNWVDHSGVIKKLQLTSIPAGDFRNLYVNDERAYRARGNEIKPWAAKKDSEGNIIGMIFNNTDIGSWNNMEDMELVWPELGWSSSRLPVSNVEAYGSDRQTLYIEPMSMKWNYSSHGAISVRASANLYAENALELLDEPGEFYLDKDTKTLYYYPRNGQNMSTAEVYVPVVETLVDIKGTSLSNKVKNLQFEGIHFKHTSFLRTNTLGYTSLQSSMWVNGENQYDAMPIYRGYQPSAAVEIDLADDIVFESCELAHLGAIGIAMKNGVTDSVIHNSSVLDASDAGIVIGSWLHDYVDSGEQVPTDIIIKNNLIDGAGVEYYSGCGITSYYTDGLIIAHNEITDIAYHGISMGWAHQYRKNSTTNKDNKILNNYIHDYLVHLVDGGAIYGSGQMPGTVWSGNYMKDQINSKAAMYPDQGSAYIMMKDNVVENIGANRYVYMWSPAIVDCVVKDTYTDTETVYNKGTNCSITDTHYYPNGNWPQAAQDIIDNAGIRLNPGDPREVISTPSPVTVTNPIYEYNFARNHDASSSNNKGGYTEFKAYRAHHAVTDFRTDTYWEGEYISSEEWWIEVDLGTQRSIKAALINEYDDNGKTIMDYKVQYWTGSNWANAYQGSNPDTYQVVSFSEVTTSKVRLLMNGTKRAGKAPAVLDFGVYAETNHALPSQNIALNQTVSSSNDYSASMNGDKAVDGDASTRWATDDNIENFWLEVDFGSPKTFIKTVFTECLNYGQRIDSYRIQYFNGSSWVDIATGGVPSATQVNTFNPVTAQKVRLYMTDNDKVGPTIWEFEVWN